MYRSKSDLMLHEEAGGGLGTHQHHFVLIELPDLPAPQKSKQSQSRWLSDNSEPTVAATRSQVTRRDDHSPIVQHSREYNLHGFRGAFTVPCRQVLFLISLVFVRSFNNSQEQGGAKGLLVHRPKRPRFHPIFDLFSLVLQKLAQGEMYGEYSTGMHNSHPVIYPDYSTVLQVENRSRNKEILPRFVSAGLPNSQFSHQL